jgi:hypothetical protein
MTQLVRERFPDGAAEIRDCYVRDLEFRALCHDYGVSVGERRRLTECPSSKDLDQRIEQFRELNRELEMEIIEHLNSALTGPD